MRPLHLELADRQRTFPFDLEFVARLTQAGYPACLAAAQNRSAPITKLAAIEGTILSDRKMSAVHREFFGDPSPTDVITFQHGEILLGAGVIVENAARFCRSVDEEAALCLIHGMLHLAGWSDRIPSEEKRMARRQEQIFKLARRMV